MTRTSWSFIHICNETDHNKRLDELAKKIGFAAQVLTPYRNKLNSIMDFISELDGLCHVYDDKRHPYFLLYYTVHQHIPSDLRSLIILAATKQNYQLNIILRHFIEVFIVTLFADLTCNFKDAFYFFLYSKQWKPYRIKQRIYWEFQKDFPNRSIKNRLENIKLLNLISGNVKRFYKRYIASASYCDFRNLFSLPICKSCKNDPQYKGQVKYYPYHLNIKLRKKGKEDIHSKFKTNFTYVCSFCNKSKLTSGYTIGIPNTTDMLDMLIAISPDRIRNQFKILKGFYGYLSADFVHFSTSVMMDFKPQAQDIGGKKITIWGLEGVRFCMEVLEPLMKYYFLKLKESRRKKR
jgi:hypothetical protein